MQQDMAPAAGRQQGRHPALPADPALPQTGLCCLGEYLLLLVLTPAEQFSKQLLLLSDNASQGCWCCNPQVPIPLNPPTGTPLHSVTHLYPVSQPP